MNCTTYICPKRSNKKAPTQQKRFAESNFVLLKIKSKESENEHITIELTIDIYGGIYLLIIILEYLFYSLSQR